MKWRSEDIQIILVLVNEATFISSFKARLDIWVDSFVTKIDRAMKKEGSHRLSVFSRLSWYPAPDPMVL
jgi:hypothetical protein